jgi:hypothetical protein
MISKNISLEDSILDLIDNCLDGARKAKYAINAMYGCNVRRRRRKATT